MKKQTTIGRALEELHILPLPISVNQLLARLPPGHCKATLSRGLRRARARGDVTSVRLGREVLWELNRSSSVKVPNGTRQSSMVQNFASTYGPLKGGNNMCRPNSMPTTMKAIEEEVAALVAAKEKFSAYDVTKKLREKVNTDQLTSIDNSETGTVFVGGKEVPKIDHGVVRDAVHDIFNAGEMPGYDRTHNGVNWEYHEFVDFPKAADSSDSDDDPPATDDPTSDPSTPYDGNPTL